MTNWFWRSSITYRLPGGFSATYSGTPRPLWEWIAHTWVAGLTFWKMWIREALFFMEMGRIPYPTQVSAALVGDIKRVIDRLRGESRMTKTPRRRREPLNYRIAFWSLILILAVQFSFKVLMHNDSDGCRVSELPHGTDSVVWEQAR